MSDSFWLAATAIGTVAMAMAVIVTAFFAWGTLKGARDDSRARTRPIMIAELRREALSHGAILLVLKNRGASVANDVAVTFDHEAPPDVDSLPDSDLWKWVFQRYRKPVTTWAPGWTISNVIRVGEDELLNVRVKVAYTGPDETKYHDVFNLNPDHILKETSVTPSKEKDPIKIEQQKVAALQALVRTVRSL